MNIFIDETGEFGLGTRSAKLYGTSLVFHEQDFNITRQLEKLKEKYDEINYQGMVHMGDLINGHGEYIGMTVEQRKKIFLALYKFSCSVKVKYAALIFEKKFADDEVRLQNELRMMFKNLIEENLEYIQKFDKVVVYYDSGQKPLASVIDSEFGTIFSYERKSRFNHQEKKLFQVADMLTFLDKLIYKNKHNIKLSNSEKLFFSGREIRIMTREIEKRRLIKKAPIRVLF